MEKIHITVQWMHTGDPNAVLDLEASTTVAGVKAMVSKEPLSKLHLHYGGEELQDDRTLSDYEVSDGHTLSVTLDDVPFAVNIMTGDGAVHIFSSMSGRMTVAQAFEKVQTQLQLPPNRCALAINGQIMDLKTKLRGYGVGEGTTLNVVLRGSRLYEWDSQQLSPRNNFAFPDHDTQEFTRGGKKYSRPVGSKGFALCVVGKYSDGDDWLTSESSFFNLYFAVGKNADGKRMIDVGWEMSKDAKLPISTFKSTAAYFGTTEPAEARKFAKTFYVDTGNGSKKCEVVLQARANPATCVAMSKGFYAVPTENDLRPYRICVWGDVPLQESVCMAAVQSLQSETILVQQKEYQQLTNGGTAGSGVFSLFACHQRLSAMGPIHPAPAPSADVEPSAVVTVPWPNGLDHSVLTADCGALTQYPEVTATFANSRVSLSGPKAEVLRCQQAIQAAFALTGRSNWVSCTAEAVLFLLPVTDADYIAAAAAFSDTMPSATIVKIERCENRKLYRKYCRERGGLAKKMLFHGTSNTDPEKVWNSESGFLRNYASLGMWGRATYFAESAVYSDKYAHAAAAGTDKVLLYCEVAVGESETRAADKTIVDAGTVPNSKPQRQYDSVQGSTLDTTVYMIYRDFRAYPSFLITYH